VEKRHNKYLGIEEKREIYACRFLGKIVKVAFTPLKCNVMSDITWSGRYRNRSLCPPPPRCRKDSVRNLRVKRSPFSPLFFALSAPFTPDSIVGKFYFP
jgi:hypothetical protein